MLFITWKVDESDWLAGFVCGWIEHLSRKVDRLEILCLERGEHSLNIPVYSMGKEQGRGRLGVLFNFHRHLVSCFDHVDVVFCHMNPIYAVLAAPYVRFFGKRLVFWYAHGHVSMLLKWAARLSDRVLTSTAEGYGLKYPEPTIMGQGIDLKRFRLSQKKGTNHTFKIVSVGRISPIKNLSILIDAVGILVKEKGVRNICLILAGGPGRTGHEAYLKSLQSQVEESGLEKWVRFEGAVPHSEIPSFYRQADLFCTMCDTGALDKAIIEAMASGVPVIGNNPGFMSIARTNGLDEWVVEGSRSLAEAIDRFRKLTLPQRRDLAGKGRKIAAEHDLDRLTDRLATVFQQVQKDRRTDHRPRLDFIINSRVPSERAHFLQAIKMCESFAGEGYRVRFCHPKRINTPRMENILDMWNFFGVQKGFSFYRLWALDLSFPDTRLDVWRFWISEGTFVMSVFFHFLKNSTDIIYSRDRFAVFLLLAARRFISGKIFFEAHTFPNRMIKQQIKLFRKLDGLVVISQGVRDRFLQWGYPEEKIYCAPLAFDPRPFSAVGNKSSARKRLKYPSKRKLVFYIGHLFENKGVRVLAKASYYLPRNVEIVMVGGTEREIKRLEAYCKEKELLRVQLAGYQSPRRIPDYLVAADVLVIPYSGSDTAAREYNSPLKWFEYLASGRPVVASDLPSLRSLAVPGDAVIFVEPDNAQALAIGIMQALEGHLTSPRHRRKTILPSWRQRAKELVNWMNP